MQQSTQGFPRRGECLLSRVGLGIDLTLASDMLTLIQLEAADQEVGAARHSACSGRCLMEAWQRQGGSKPLPMSMPCTLQRVDVRLATASPP